MRPAADKVFTVDRWPSCDTILEKADVNKANINLLNLAMAGSVVRTDNTDYQMLKRQCYWHSDMVMRVLEKAHIFDVKKVFLFGC